MVDETLHRRSNFVVLHQPVVVFVDKRLISNTIAERSYPSFIRTSAWSGLAMDKALLMADVPSESLPFSQ